MPEESSVIVEDDESIDSCVESVEVLLSKESSFSILLLSLIISLFSILFDKLLSSL